MQNQNPKPKNREGLTMYENLTKEMQENARQARNARNCKKGKNYFKKKGKTNRESRESLRIFTISIILSMDLALQI